MSKKSKLVERFLKLPKDFTWDELITVMSYFGFEERVTGKTSGSGGRKFVDTENNVIRLHKPHPENIVKEYALKIALNAIKEKGKIKDE